METVSGEAKTQSGDLEHEKLGIIFLPRTIDEIYVDDPKKAFNSNWESIAQVVHENQEWKREMRHVSSRKKFVEEMINIKTGFIWN